MFNSVMDFTDVPFFKKKISLDRNRQITRVNNINSEQNIYFFKS